MRDIHSDAHSALLGEIYEAALEPELWSQVCERVAEATGGHSSHLMAVDTRTGTDNVNFLSRQDPAAHAEYIDTFFERDVRVPRLAAARPGRLVRDQDVWSEEEKYDSPVYQDYQRKHKLFHITGAPLGLQDRLSWFGISREVDEPFEPGELHLLQSLVPHLRQALRITLEIGALRMQREAMGGLWTAGGRGVIAVRAGGVAAFMNSAAEAMMRADLFRVASGRLSFRDAGLQAMLAAHVQALATGRALPAGPSARLISDAAGEQTGVRFLLMPARPFLDDAESAVLMVVLTPLSREAPASAAELSQFSALFAVTPAEQAVLAAVVSGTELADHARERGVSLNTARTQLKVLLSKTGCRSQKALVRLVERFCFLQLR